MKEVNLFTYCGSSQMKEKLWRDIPLKEFR